jgi:hypothetical protein
LNAVYTTLGFSDKANLDEGDMWPTAFALKELTAAEEAKIGDAREESGELRLSRHWTPPYAGSWTGFTRSSFYHENDDGRLIEDWRPSRWAQDARLGATTWS